jgi:long-subunit acyl-CoA synthetase (AMP-forming)/alkylation response protein AidB-like acyl-CoA dehydrogenase
MNPLVSRAAAAEEVRLGPDASLVGLLLARFDDAADRPAIVDGQSAGAEAWTWADVAAAAVACADRLEATGLRRGDRVAHLGLHSPDWIVFDLACLLAGIVHVPLHADATGAEHRGQLAWLAPRGIVCTGPRSGRSRSLAVAGAIVVDLSVVAPAGTGTASLLAEGRSAVSARKSLVRESLLRRVGDSDAEACCTIVLSSGATGEPHGVMHSQRTIAVNAAAAAAPFLDDPRDVRLSWLPCSHLLARTGDLGTALVRGGCLNVVADRRRVLDACSVLPPTVILGVPVFFERLESATRAGRIADLAAALGGRVRACISGGGPLRDRTAEFFAARGLPLVQGYGLAEAGPVVALATPRNVRLGATGAPLAGVEVRIDERPGSRGQLLVRTPCRTLGVVSPRDGRVHEPACVDDWLETGDLAEFDDGQLRITGRLRDTLVLATGAKVPPAAVERVLGEDEAIAQVCVVADGPSTLAIVVPEPAGVRAALKRMGVRVFSRRAALEHPRLLAWMARRIDRRQRPLPKAWRVRRVVLADRAFDVAHGETTASLKPKRDVIAAHFAARTGSAVPPVRQSSRSATSDVRPWLAECLWHGGSGGFWPASAASERPLAAAVESVLERAEVEIVRLRQDGALYGPAPGRLASAAPLDDPPPSVTGTFSPAAETALGQVGVWGLAVPEAFGGSGCTMGELARAISRLAANVPTAAGMLAVHSSIGAVSALTAFGTPAQQARHLPGLAAGSPLSIFGATEPDAGCDLGRVRTVIERHDGRLRVTGTKMFITGATYGRLVKLLAQHDGRPAVALVRLPDADTPAFRLRRYDLHPLRHAHNAALEFAGLEIDEVDLLDPKAGGADDAMRIVWHGLDRGRATLTAQAAGTLRLLLGQARAHAARRTTWGRPIGTRQLVQGRLARIAAAAVACDAMAAWAAAAIDMGPHAESEAIAAKVLASGCVRDAAIDALGVHGGRAFLVGHPLGDSLHDHLAVSVYEGESDLLGLALFKGLAKRHPAAGAERDGSALPRVAGWLAWRAAAVSRSVTDADASILDGRLRGHARLARRLLAERALDIDRAIRRHGRGLAERQLDVGAMSAAVRELAGVLAVAHAADATAHEAAQLAGDCWCRLALARSRGVRPSAADHAALAALGRGLADGSLELPPAGG